MREPDVPAQPADVPPDVEHELINSVASIVGFSQLISRDPSLPDDLRHNADLLVQEATKTRRIVGDLLDLVRRRSAQERPADPDAGAVPVAAGPTTNATGTLIHGTTRAAAATETATHGTTRAAAATETPTHGTAGTAGPPESTAARAGPTAAFRPSVLVLDDTSSFRAFLENALRALGYEPVMTASGRETVERATDGDHAALLVDHQVPGMSGIQVYEAVVALRPEMADRFLIMSGDVDDPALQSFAEANGVRLLGKPFDLDTLDRTIRAVLARSSQPRG